MPHPHLTRFLAVPIVLAIVLGLRYRSTMSRGWRLGWYALMAAVVCLEAIPILATIRQNVATVPAWDFLGFWLNAHVAAAGQNFYEPVHAQLLARGMPIAPDFRREILDVGFWYPAPSIFIFLPLAAFADQHVAYAWWYALQMAALALAIAVLARTFLPSQGPLEGSFIVAALVLLMPATGSTISYGQTTFLALLFTAVFWWIRERKRGGAWLVLAAIAKPFAGGLALALLCRRRWRPLAGAAIAAVALCAITVLAFGATTFVAYLRARPDARLPAWVYAEPTNQSLLGLLLRAGHGVASDHLQRGPLLLFAIAAFGLTALTIWLSLNCAELDIALALTLALMLSIYPASQSFYAVFLIVPLLVAWRRCSLVGSRYATTLAGIAVAYLLMIAGQAGLAYLLSWFAFAILAAPTRLLESLRALVTPFGGHERGFVKREPGGSTADTLSRFGVEHEG